MTPEEHLSMAGYYADIFDETWKSSRAHLVCFTQTDVGVNDNVLRAAEAHLKLAAAKRVSTVKISDGMMSC